MPLSLADLFKYHADKSVRTAYARNDDQEERESDLKMAQRCMEAAAVQRESGLKMAQRWMEAAAVLQAQRVRRR
jgi:hypothetical protein